MNSRHEEPMTEQKPLDDLQRKLAELIKESCNLVDPIPDDLSPDAPLIGPESPMGLDILDAVEIVVMVQRNFGIRIESEESSRQVLVSLQTLSDFIRRQNPQAS